MTKEKPTILVAEDDRFLSRALAEELGSEGFGVVSAFDGMEALEKIRSAKPDLILLDLIMPKRNGFEVLEEIKMDETLFDIPVIVLSNLGQEQDVKTAKELGAVDYFIKSNISLKSLVEKVKFYLVR